MSDAGRDVDVVEGTADEVVAKTFEDEPLGSLLMETVED